MRGRRDLSLFRWVEFSKTSCSTVDDRVGTCEGLTPVLQLPASELVERSQPVLGADQLVLAEIAPPALRREAATTVYTVSASGVVLPPVFIFPRVQYHDLFMKCPERFNRSCDKIQLDEQGAVCVVSGECDPPDTMHCMWITRSF